MEIEGQRVIKDTVSPITIMTTQVSHQGSRVNRPETIMIFMTKKLRTLDLISSVNSDQRVQTLSLLDPVKAPTN